MDVHEIPREYKGEGRILMIFSSKALIYTVVGATIGLPFFLILRESNHTFIGLLIMAFFGFIGFSIATFKIPESQSFALTRKAGGEKIDDIILRWLKFKRKKNKIYIYKNEKIKREERTHE